ncbi:MAG: sulfatase [Lentisphaerae bacterium]|nr:sulfatase [Lentisphaerota bacterium]
MATTRPNILLVLSDDHSVPHVGCYGSPNVKTPNLDRFTLQGMRFNRAYTTSPQCAPSRASIFTGRSPVSLGVTRFAQPARPDTVFFTDIMRANGYFTGLIGRNHHLAGRTIHTPVEQEALEAAGLLYAESRFDVVNTFGTKLETGLDRVPQGLNAFLDAVPGETPFCLYLGFNQPHTKWSADHPDFQPDPAALKLPGHLPDLPEVRQDYAQFLKDIFDLDRGFGRVMDILDQRGLADNTIVLFMGDNGEALIRGKGTLYNSGNNVPLLIRWPGVVEANAVTDALVSGEDLAPTLLDVVGLEPEPRTTGVSFLPLLQGKPFEPRKYAFVERGYHGRIGPIDLSCNMDFSRGVVSDRYFFIYNTTREKPFAPVDVKGLPMWEATVKAHENGTLSSEHERIYFGPRPMFELYDLHTDPDQFNNLADDPAHNAAGIELRDVLTQWMIREQDYLPLPNYTGKRGAS